MANGALSRSTMVGIPPKCWASVALGCGESNVTIRTGRMRCTSRKTLRRGARTGPELQHGGGAGECAADGQFMSPHHLTESQAGPQTAGEADRQEQVDGAPGTGRGPRLALPAGAPCRFPPGTLPCRGLDGAAWGRVVWTMSATFPVVFETDDTPAVKLPGWQFASC